MPNVQTDAAKTILSSGRVLVLSECDDPIAVNLSATDDKPFKTKCKVTFRRGKSLHLEIDAGYTFDGASVPRPLWILKGFGPLDKTIIAALFHDYCCDNPDELDRVIADAVFVTLLKHSGVGCVRRWLMFKAVRLWSTWRAAEDLWNWRDSFDGPE